MPTRAIDDNRGEPRSNRAPLGVERGPTPPRAKQRFLNNIPGVIESDEAGRNRRQDDGVRRHYFLELSLADRRSVNRRTILR
jgi:hypothetical protein